MGRVFIGFYVQTPIRFGVFEVDLASGELRKQGVRIKLQEQPFQALLVLIARPGEVVTREELQKRLWPGDSAGDFDRGLNKAIARVREALGDDADNPTFIETLPQRGYRFLLNVDAGRIERPVSPTVPLPTKPTTARRTLLAGAGLAAITAAVYSFQKSRSRPIESIAVLPLENLSGDPAQDYFSDGLTDELIGEIARIGSLRVISRTSVMQYKGGTRKSLPEIARQLNVDAILEGTVLQAGQKVRITAQLIRAQDDRHLWSEKYERDLSDVLVLQAEVARAVAAQIKIKLTPPEQASLSRTRQVHPEAHNAYLKGNFFLQKGISGMGKSVAYFKQALEMDPASAECHAGLAEALCFSGIFGLRPSGETYPEARLHAQRALELDSSNASAHNALADVKQGYDWDFAGAEAEFQRALQLNPSHLRARSWRAECLTRRGKFEEAIAESARAVELDPVSAASVNVRAMVFYRARRYDESIRASQQALELDPSFVTALWWQGMAYAGKRDFPQSVASLTKAVGMSRGSLFPALLGFVHGRAGEKQKALAMLGQVTKLSQEQYVTPVDFAMIHAGLGDADSTFLWLENAYQARSVRVVEVRCACFDHFRSDPRYANLMGRLRLPIA